MRFTHYLDEHIEPEGFRHFEIKPFENHGKSAMIYMKENRIKAMAFSFGIHEYTLLDNVPLAPEDMSIVNPNQAFAYLHKSVRKCIDVEIDFAKFKHHLNPNIFKGQRNWILYKTYE